MSVIIPIGPAETNYQDLVSSIRSFSQKIEIILVFPANFPKQDSDQHLDVIKIYKGSSRAEQLNIGAKFAKGKYYWFLHADSMVDKNSIIKLIGCLRQRSKELIYFDLRFFGSSSVLVKINAWGANFRSKWFKVPFGDQGFCIHHQIFDIVEGYPEGLDYGEDHVFVWRLRQCGVGIKPLEAPIYTSSRKYTKQGWLNTTILHQYLWIKQAFPEWKELRRIKNENRHRNFC